MRICGSLAGALIATCLVSVPVRAETINLTGYKLTFDEEFNARSISQDGVGKTWADIRPWARYDANSDVGFGKSSFLDAASGFDPLSVSGGALTITGIPYTMRFGYPGSWQSGLLHTRESFTQAYGYFEIRAHFNSVPGTWPAFWLLPVTTLHPPGRDASLWQELDILEQYGAYTQGVFSGVHTTEPAPPGVQWDLFSSHPEISSGYHTYGLDWEPDTLRFYVDGVLMGTKPTPDDMTGPMYPIVDLGRDNAYPGNAAAMSMNIDYIRVFSKNPLATAIRQDVISAPDGHDPGLYGATAAIAPAVLSANRLSLSASEDAYQGNSEFTVGVDGVAIGGVRSTTGSRSSPQTFTIPASLSRGTHKVSVNFLNALDQGLGKARRLYVNSITVDGVRRSGPATMVANGEQAFRISIP